MKIDKTKLKDTIWTIIIAGILILLLINLTVGTGNVCLAKLVEIKDYYINFLWPRVYSYVNILFMIPMFVCGYYYSECLMEVDPKTTKKELIVLRNVALASVSVLGVSYGLINLLWLKVINVVVVAFAIVAVAAIVFIIINHREYKALDEDVTIEEIWSGVSTRLSILLVVAVVCSLLFFNVITKGVEESKESYKNVSLEKVELCFGHIQGFEDNRATVKVEFVNMYGDSGREYTIEELEQEYTNFKAGKGSWSTLWSFCEDSIAIELKSQGEVSDHSSRIVYDDSNTYLDEYYCPEERYKVKDRLYKERNDKLDDIIYFTICVEEELNLQGLTLRQLNDSGDMDEDLPDYLELGYESATREQVTSACHSFAAKSEPIDGSKPLISEVDSIDLNIDLCAGRTIKDVVITEENGYSIEKVEWSRSSGTSNYFTLEEDSRVYDSGLYKLSVYFNLPIAYNISEDLQVTLQGITYETLKLDDFYKGDINEFKVDITINMWNVPELKIAGLEIGLDNMKPEDYMADCIVSDDSRFCDAEYVGWQVYDVETGTATEYTDIKFLEENMCYIATLKVTPKDGAAFEDVEFLYQGKNIEVYEYDPSIHSYRAGEYPQAYFERVSQDGEDYIMAYVPYYLAYTTGDNGQLYCDSQEGTMVYLPQGGTLSIFSSPNTYYQLSSYSVIDYKGNEMDSYNAKYADYEVLMPAHPIKVMGYFELKVKE